MHIVKILKRKDAASVIVAIVMAFILSNIVSVLTSDLATFLSGIETAGMEWREDLVRPMISAALQLVFLEALLRIVVAARPTLVRKG